MSQHLKPQMGQDKKGERDHAYLQGTSSPGRGGRSRRRTQRSGGVRKVISAASSPTVAVTCAKLEGTTQLQTATLSECTAGATGGVRHRQLHAEWRRRDLDKQHHYELHGHSHAPGQEMPEDILGVQDRRFGDVEHERQHPERRSRQDVGLLRSDERSSQNREGNDGQVLNGAFSLEVEGNRATVRDSVTLLDGGNNDSRGDSALTLVGVHRANRIASGPRPPPRPSGGARRSERDHGPERSARKTASPMGEDGGALAILGT